ncbi:hypothetical protein OUZ56_007338 [Daphnia magna]|uniref:Uncharacterized protein n=1 Tax=Daphnia magna TaxID=35525 RepID=A0ABQ9YYC0_9CRUS|nr:hypothetical protein OUZ56_007338 [Daphnia magna]
MQSPWETNDNAGTGYTSGDASKEGQLKMSELEMRITKTAGRAFFFRWSQDVHIDAIHPVLPHLHKLSHLLAHRRKSNVKPHYIVVIATLVLPFMKKVGGRESRCYIGIVPFHCATRLSPSQHLTIVQQQSLGLVINRGKEHRAVEHVACSTGTCVVVATEFSLSI